MATRTTKPRAAKPHGKKAQGKNAARLAALRPLLPVLYFFLFLFVLSLPLHCGMLYSCPRPLENVLDKIGCHALGKKPGMCTYIGYKYFKRQEWERARTYFEIEAQQGFTKAQNYLGSLYYKGRGGARDYAKAKEWFEKAAANGSANAQTWLGIMYEEGNGVAKDTAKARAYYEQACNSDYEVACKYLKEL